MERVFERAAEELKAAGIAGSVSVSDTQKLRLYGLFKQTTIGDCRSSAPSAFRPVERAKWTSWNELHGLDATEAKRRYILMVKGLLPNFNDEGAMQSQVEQVQETPRPIQRQKSSSDQLSYGRVVGQFLVWMAAAGGLLSVVVKFLLPWGRRFALVQLRGDVERLDELVQSLAPLLWFALGYSFVVMLRSQTFPWRLLSGDYVWHSAVTPLAHSAGRIRRRRRRRVPVESETDVFLRKHNIQVVQQSVDGKKTSRLMIKLPDDPDAFQFGDCNSTIPYTLEQTADVYYRKFKEPLPDPASRLLDSITVLEERRLDEYCAVFKRRLMRFRNEAPSLIKRFASSEFVEYIEDSLLDKQNRMFYVYVKNESFQSLGVLEDYSVYQAHTNKAHWAELHQFCRVHITSSSLSFFRSKIESFISNFYCKNAPDARSYHLQRISEEFGEPDKD
ncbi:hypothetical protein G195_006004 [Phytophthora kernoviae 00238/432]|uniref:ACB domain-containing protein n=1 Tax=Phytophthora kernoviae 00238/432 TaxID=1284355 RepID=A0A8J4W6I0_9STRA|nr:hypothetical protein G195_006004 [Phytophthora kernoviae 00238/432]